MSARKTRQLTMRRERRKAKQQEWTRAPQSKVGHHSNDTHWSQGAKVRLPCR